MADTDELTRQIILGAIVAAGAAGSNEGAWKGRVNQAIPHVAAMMGESSRQSRLAAQMLDAQVFVANYRGYELEESSQRLNVALYTNITQKRPDGIERIRTHRIDSPLGRYMQQRIDRQLQTGDDVLVWRVMEQMANSDNKVRVLAHFERLPARPKENA